MFYVMGLDRSRKVKSVLFPLPFVSESAAQRYIEDHVLDDAWSEVWIDEGVKESPLQPVLVES